MKKHITIIDYKIITFKVFSTFSTHRVNNSTSRIFFEDVTFYSTV